MHVFLLFFLFMLSSTSSRNLRKLDDEIPFDVNTDLFSQSLSLIPPEDDQGEELPVAMSRRFTGPMPVDLVTALPPGYSPMPPGFNTDQERIMNEIRNGQSEVPDIKEERFHIAEMDSDKEDDGDEIEEEEEQSSREHREFSNEVVVPSSPELELFPTTTNIYSDEDNSIQEGSGNDQQMIRGDNSTEGSGRSSEEETAFLLHQPRVKVSGEVGMETQEDGDGERKERTNTVSVDTFLFPPLENDSEHPNRTTAVRGAVDGCPTPELCARNCFVSLDDQGCQTCQCLWQAMTCEKDADCPESIQKCDLGKCDCSDGFVQDMTRSGMCKETEEAAEEDLSLQSLGVDKNFDETQENYKRIKLYKIKKRQKRSTVYGEKPRRAERLQWPGSCDAGNHCPSPLVCIRGDCWQLPDKPLRRKDSVPDSFVISSDDNWEMESELQSKLFQPTRSRALMRFVGKTAPTITREMVERTTMTSTDTQPNQLFEWRKSSVTAEEPQLAPSTVNEMYTSTHSWMDSTPDPIEDALPPSPPPENIGEEVSNLPWPTMPPDTLAKAFTKMIELPQEQVLKLKPKTEKKTETRRKATAMTSTLDPIEFPISSQLESLKRDGIRVEPPLALSATPAIEEIDSHDQFMKALDEQRRRIKQRVDLIERPTSTPFPPIFPTLRTTDAFTTPLVLQALRQPEEEDLMEEEQKPGVWYTMSTTETHERRRAPPVSTSPPFVRKRPVKIIGVITDKIDDECTTDKHCGRRFRCCLKRWCDSVGNCSTARFCLPFCESTKTINRRSGMLDLVDD